MSKKLPFVKSDIPQDLRFFLDRVRELVSGSGADRLISLGDLTSAGLAGSNSSGGLLPPPKPFLAIPPAPTNVTATAAIRTIFIEFDAPAYPGHAYAEVWGASTNSLGAAVLLGMTPGSIYVDETGPSTTRFYWVRFVNTNDVRGPYNGTNGVSATTGPEVSYLLATLSNAITESQLFSSLGNRINLVDGLASVPGSVNARVQTEATTRANADTAISSTVTTLQATVGANTAAIQTEATTRANADGTLFAQYTVKIDTNGYVSGFGLASTANNATPFSDFIIRADRFSIASPSGPGIAPVVPFIVTTTSQVINGVTVPSGTYIKDAFIQNGVITNAKIGNLAVDDAKIANLSVGKLTAGSISAGQFIQSSNFISGTQGFRLDANGTAEFGAASIRGQLTAGQIDTRGLSIKDANGNIILAAGSPLSTGNISGLGTLATQNSVNWNSQLINIPAFGNFAYLSTITSANISTYIASAAIGTAYISDLNATKLTSGSISVGTTISGNYSAGSTGWYIDGSGNAEFNQITVRSGQVTGALLRSTAVPLFFSGVHYVINSSISNDPNAVYLRFFVSGVAVYVPHIVIWAGTVPAPETAAHRIAASISAAAQNNSGGTSRDFSIMLVVPYLVEFETFVDPGGTTRTARVIQLGSDVIANQGVSGPFSFSASATGSTVNTYTTAQPAAILVSGNNANNTVGNVGGLFWGVR